MTSTPQSDPAEVAKFDAIAHRFWDERGEGPFPGGWFRYFQPTPIVLVQIEPGNGAPLDVFASRVVLNFITSMPKVLFRRAKSMPFS